MDSDACCSCLDPLYSMEYQRYLCEWPILGNVRNVVSVTFATMSYICTSSYRSSFRREHTPSTETEKSWASSSTCSTFTARCWEQVYGEWTSLEHDSWTCYRVCLGSKCWIYTTSAEKRLFLHCFVGRVPWWMRPVAVSNVHPVAPKMSETLRRCTARNHQVLKLAARQSAAPPQQQVVLNHGNLRTK